MLEIFVVGDVEGRVSVVVLDGDVGAPGQQEVDGGLGGGVVEDSVMQRRVAEVVPHAEVRPGLQQQAHDVRELGRFDGYLRQQGLTS